MAESTAGSSGSGEGAGGSGSGAAAGGGAGEGAGGGTGGGTGGATGGGAGEGGGASTGGGTDSGGGTGSASTGAGGTGGPGTNVQGGAFTGAAANTTAAFSSGAFGGAAANTAGGGFTGRGSTQGRTDPPLGISGARLDPLESYQFSVTFGAGTGQFVAYATEVSGLDFERDYIEHKYVNKQYQAITQMIPGRIKWQPVTLKRLLTTDTAMWDWFMDHEGPSVNTGSYSPKKYAAARLPVTIVAYTRNFTEAIRWELSNAWPSKIGGPSFDSKSGDFSFEEVTLVFESITRTTTAGSGSTESVTFTRISGG